MGNRNTFIPMALLAIAFFSNGHAVADRYTFEHVVQPGDFVGIGDPSMNNRGDVVFRAATRAGTTGIYTGPNHETDLIVDTSNFERIFYPAINDHGEIVFYAEPEYEVGAIYRFSEGILDEVARHDGEKFFEFAPTFYDPMNLPPPPRINNNGDIAFYAHARGADGEGFPGIFSGPDPDNDIWAHGREDGNAGFYSFSADGHYPYAFDINDSGEIAFVTNVEHVDLNGDSFHSNKVVKGKDGSFEDVIFGKCTFLPTRPACIELPSEMPNYGFSHFGGVDHMNEAGDFSFSSGHTRDGEVLKNNPLAINHSFLDGNSTPIFEGRLTPDGRFDGPRGIVAGDHPVTDLVFRFGDEINGEIYNFANIEDVNESGQILLLLDGKTLTIATPHPVPIGDFDNDTLLTANDIDVLSVAIRDGSEKPLFDLNGDELVNARDRVTWVEDLAGTLLGDADLDKDVDFKDFLQVSTNFGEQGGWHEGDFLGDGTVGFDDFLELSSRFGFSTTVATVPEPVASAWLIFLVCLVARAKRV